MTGLTCTRCAKRLSRKTARQIDGVVMCGNCMFRPPASVIEAASAGETAQTGSTEGESAVRDSGDAQPHSEQSS